MSILLLKSATGDGATGDWTGLSGDVRIVSPLQFDWIDLDALTEKICKPENYHGIVFTSQRCVEAFDRASKAVEGRFEAGWKDKVVYVVGHETGRQVQQLFSPWHRGEILGQDTGNAKALAKLVLESQLHTAARLLYPCGQMEAMSKQFEGHEDVLHKSVAYCTARSDSLDSDLQGLPEVLQAVVFFSPSGVKFALLQLLDSSKEIKAFIAIGPTTHQALQQVIRDIEKTSNIPLYQAETPDPSGVKAVLGKIDASLLT